MKIKAVVATTFNDAINGWSYTESALSTLSDSAEGKPVIYQRKHIGQVTHAFVKSKQAVVEAEVDTCEEIVNKKLYLVPGGLTDFETKDDKIWKCNAQQFFLTDEPSDQDLTVIEKG